MTLVDRRTIMGGGALLATLGGVAPARIGDHDEVIPLWPDEPPGGHPLEIRRKVDDHSTEAGRPDRWITGVARPSLIVRRPVRANGAAVLVVPGGGYEFLSFDNEGTTQADWLVARGMTAFILIYRLPGEGWQRRSLVPLQDAQRAIRIIRGDHVRFGIRPDRIGVLGFSAGGHLAGSLATRHRERTYDRIDHRDDLSARPDVAGLLYPVVSLDAPFTHGGSRDALLGSGIGEEARRRASIERRVDAMTSPTMLVHAADDGLVPPANSVAMFDALQAAGRPTALHIFEDGGHGFGNRLPRSRSASAWPDLFMTFAGRQGLFG